MTKQKVFLVGATGETGSSILEGLIEDGSFDITCFVRTASAGKPAAQKLRDRGLKVVTGDFSGPTEETVALLEGIDTIIGAFRAQSITDQIPLVTAAVQAGVKRFVPCNWAVPGARGGLMDARDKKEEVHDYIFRDRLGFTIIDVGYWYELSFPRVPSGKLDYAIAVPANELYAGGTTPNMLIGKRDVGRITAKIVRDERTLNKRVYAYGDLLSQNEVNAIVERKTGEKLELKHVSADEIHANIKAAEAAAEAGSTDLGARYKLILSQYANVKYVRGDNTPENAEYLGYIDGNALYPDFKFTKFEDFVDELLAGKVTRPYADMKF
ncbi:NAD(P)-binding protein [Biscogniauxia marginata]|nr:NAD(P)-binding protein [Biscogniauxia marginata]